MSSRMQKLAKHENSREETRTYFLFDVFVSR